MQSVTFAPVSVADGPAIAANNVLSFWTDKTWVLVWGSRTRDYVAAQAAKRGRNNLLTDMAHRRHMKAVDIETDVDEETKRDAEREAGTADWNVDDIGGLDAPISSMDKKLKEGRRYMVLDYLCVRPEYRRRGIAVALVQRGIEAADKLGLDTFVLSMRAGVGVYQKAGFVLLDRVLVDASGVGGDKDYGGWFLERKCRERVGEDTAWTETRVQWRPLDD